MGNSLNVSLQDRRPVRFHVVFEGNRKKQLEEECPGYPKAQLLDILAAILRKRTTTKRQRTSGGIGVNDKLFSIAEVAARSPALFWSIHQTDQQSPAQEVLGRLVEEARAAL